MFAILRSTARQTDIGLTLVRIVTGVIFMMHGGQKLFVYGLEGVSGAFGQMGIPFAGLMGPFVGILEFAGGLALILGLLTRPIALGLAVTMVVAMLQVHLAAGFFLPNGYEFVLALFGSAAAFAIAGAGPFSIDAVIATRVGRAGARTDLRPARRAA